MTFRRLCYFVAIFNCLATVAVLTGCGHSNSTGITVVGKSDSNSDQSQAPKEPPKAVHWQEMNDGTYWVTVNTPEGKTLYCFEDSYANNSSSLSVSCNWQEYNR
jgi:hypothetical protein